MNRCIATAASNQCSSASTALGSSSSSIMRLDRSFFAQPCLDVARELIGKHLVHRVDGRRLSGRIVETEAYVGEEDEACHARFGVKGRARVMWGPPGHSYVFLIYGMYDCFNIVTEPT